MIFLLLFFYFVLNRNLPLRKMYGDIEPKGVAFLEHKEVVDLTNCALDLYPENLPQKR